MSSISARLHSTFQDHRIIGELELRPAVKRIDGGGHIDVGGNDEAQQEMRGPNGVLLVDRDVPVVHVNGYRGYK